MTDVQASNARRIGFTAFAVVAFLLLSRACYWSGPYLRYEGTGHTVITLFDSYDSDRWWPLWGLFTALLPATFLALSVCNGWRDLLRKPWVLVAAFLFTFALGFVYWLGWHDISEDVVSVNLMRFEIFKSDPSRVLVPLEKAIAKAKAEAMASHEVSWLLLLLPIILTTAFVIFGAWRSAVADRGSLREA